MILLTFLINGLLADRVSKPASGAATRSINPECPDEQSAVECEDDCFFDQYSCLSGCSSDDRDCITSCNREYTKCLDHCPCYIECYFGCPCPYQSPYCYECEDKHEDEFMDCKSRILSIMDDCIADCEPFNESCDTDCFIDYHNRIKSCPCMDNCQSGCPCEDNHYNCTLYTTTTAKTTPPTGMTTAPILGDEYIDDLTAGKLVTIGNPLDGECFLADSYLNDFSTRDNNVYHVSGSATTPQECINYCKSNYQEQYIYAGIRSSTCFCGNTPPYMESESCTTPCSGDSSKTCGGPNTNTNFYTVPNQKQICDFGIREATDGDYLVRNIRSSKSGDYTDNQHCWSRFTCTDDRHAEYKIASSFYLESGYDYLYLYGNQSAQLTIIDSDFTSTERWFSLGDSNISIEFRTDASVVGIGFDMELRCMPN